MKRKMISNRKGKVKKERERSASWKSKWSEWLERSGRRYRSLSRFAQSAHSRDEAGEERKLWLPFAEKEKKRSSVGLPSTYIRKKDISISLLVRSQFSFSTNAFPTPLFHHRRCLRQRVWPPTNNLSASTRTNVFRAVLALHGTTRFEFAPMLIKLLSKSFAGNFTRELNRLLQFCNLRGEVVLPFKLLYR